MLGESVEAIIPLILPSVNAELSDRMRVFLIRSFMRGADIHLNFAVVAVAVPG